MFFPKAAQPSAILNLMTEVMTRQNSMAERISYFILLFFREWLVLNTTMSVLIAAVESLLDLAS